MSQEQEHSRPSRLWPELLTVTAFCAFFFFFGLRAIGLAGADEPRYAQIAREMLARHDWITPVLYGKSWLEKPVLYYWQAIIAYKIFGVSDWAARLPSAISASTMVLAIFASMRRFQPGAAIDAALITAATAACIGFSHAASTDMPLTAMFTIAMLCWIATNVGEQYSRRSLLGFYFFLALATLAKGPVAPGLAAMIIIVYAAITRSWKPIKITLWWPGILLFFAVATPWYIAVQQANPQFAREFFLEQNLARFGTNLYRHKQPSWYYLPVLVIALLPWTVYAIAGFCERFKKQKEKPQSTQKYTEAVNLRLVLMVWAVVPIVFFSISQSKLPGYVLPAIPAWTLLLALLLADGREAARANLGMIIAHAVISGALVPAVILLPRILLREPIDALQLVISACVGIALLIAIVWTLRTRGLAWLRFVTLVPVVVAFAYLVAVDAPVLDAKVSARELARRISETAAKSTPVAVFQTRRDVQFGLGFYLNEAIPSYDFGEVPLTDHLVVAKQGSGDAIRQIAGRRVSHIGSYPAQHLELFWVSNAQPVQTPEVQKPTSMTN